MVPMKRIRGNYESSDRWFDIWLTRNLNETMMTMSEVAEQLMMSHQTISIYKSGKQKPPFTAIVALCWVFGMKDNPYDVYTYVERDWL